jgi:hypothetical protein
MIAEHPYTVMCQFGTSASWTGSQGPADLRMWNAQLAHVGIAEMWNDGFSVDRPEETPVDSDFENETVCFGKIISQCVLTMAI